MMSLTVDSLKEILGLAVLLGLSMFGLFLLVKKQRLDARGTSLFAREVEVEKKEIENRIKESSLDQLVDVANKRPRPGGDGEDGSGG